MMHLHAAALALLFVAPFAVAQTTAPAASQPAIPASGDRAAAAIASSPRHGEWVEIDLADGATLHTWVSYPERADRAPVVLVIHEIFGMSDWVRAVADQLAADGFIAVAPDLLSGKGPDGGNTDSFADGDVRAAIGKLAADEVAARLDVARAYAVALPAAVDRSAVVGFCWGGSQTWNYAVRQPALKAGVVYYGTAPKDAGDLAKIKTPILGQYGRDDARVTSTVGPTEKLAAEVKMPYYETTLHDGAGHGFLRQQDGRDGANLKAAKAAWAETIAFLHARLDQ